MKFQLSTIASSIAIILATVKADDVKLFTSDGVVYSYAVITSTVKPASVYVETMYYTTTLVREITLDNSRVTSTTEEVIEASTQTTSTAEAAAATAASSSSNYIPSSRFISTLQPSSTSSLTGSTGSASSIVSSGSSQVPSQVTSTISSSPASSTTGTTTTSPSSSVTPYTTLTGSDGTCSVYYEDDEYYSTAYLTADQSVDAATTLTSTMIVYETLTLL